MRSYFGRQRSREALAIDAPAVALLIHGRYQGQWNEPRDTEQSPVLAAVFVIVTALVGVVSGRARALLTPVRQPDGRHEFLRTAARGAPFEYANSQGGKR